MSKDDQNKEFSLPRLIICEGPEDVTFFREIIKLNALPDCHIRHTGGRWEKGGHTKFGSSISNFQLDRSFKNIKRILIVYDCDDDGYERFESVCKQLVEAGFPAPDYNLVFTTSNPLLMTMSMPSGLDKGNLESSCYDAARSVDPTITAWVDHLVNHVKKSSWSEDTLIKLWLRIQIAVLSPSDPFVPLSKVFSDKHFSRAIPLHHHLFNAIVNDLVCFFG